MTETGRTQVLYFPERITKAMGMVLDYPLTVVEAPMGYGKTTAVKTHLGNAKVRLLWHKVFDGSTVNFWAGFCQLLGNVDTARATMLAQLGFPDDSLSRQEAMRVFADIDFTARTVVVIDDYHLLNSAEVGEFIQCLVVNEIENLHIVLTTRFVELSSLDELSLKGYLLHIKKSVFELTAQEIVHYYQRCGIALRAAEADELQAVTEGWISALYLLMLNYRETGSLMTTYNIYKLIETAILRQFSAPVRMFLLHICVFERFSEAQAIFMLGDDKAITYLDEITGRNAFVSYDAPSRTYQMHNILSNYLRELIEKQDADFRKDLYGKAGNWCAENGEPLEAMRFFHAAGDCDSLLLMMERDKTNCITYENKDLLIRFYDEAPEACKRRHPVAVLAYAMCMMTFYESERFGRACETFVSLLQGNDAASEENPAVPDNVEWLMGEFELLLSFTEYNDVVAMASHQKQAALLLGGPSAFLDTKGSWSFGAPSVLYLFHRESGTLDRQVQALATNFPHYHMLSGGHGMGGSSMMAAELHFQRGELENAEIALHQAEYEARQGLEPSVSICALFLQERLSLMKNNVADVFELFQKMREEVESTRNYVVLHTLDMCTGYLNALLKRTAEIPEWLCKGDFSATRMYYQTRAFANIIYGRVLLIQGAYLKLLGIADGLLETASGFPNTLAVIHTWIYVAAANERIHRLDKAGQAMATALDLAMPDRLYMPFVENCDFIRPLLETMAREGMYRQDIERILELYKSYQQAVMKLAGTQVANRALRLTKREREIVQLASEGLSNKQIGEQLFVSQNTVKTQMKSAFEKLGVNSRFLLRQVLDKNPSLV